MAPSVIYIDECEKVFVSDKKKKKEFQPYSEALDRVKKLVAKEHKKMAAGDRVLLLGNSSMPQVCQKKDKKAFVKFWDKHIYVPVPDYASLRTIWPGLFMRHNGLLTHEFDLSTLCKISENYTSGYVSAPPLRLPGLCHTPRSFHEANADGVLHLTMMHQFPAGPSTW